MPIIIRYQGATPLSDELLKDQMQMADSWGIAWKMGNDLRHIRSDERREFVSHFRRLEKEDRAMVVHLNEHLTGDKCRLNLQPFFVKNVGVLIIEGYLTQTIDEVDSHFTTDLKKSDEAIVAELFRQFCIENEHLSTVNKWKRFNDKNENLLSHMQLILYTSEGHIINDYPEAGYFKDDLHLWFSEYYELDSEPPFTLIKKENDMEEDGYELSDICERFDDWALVKRKDLIDLKKSEIAQLCDMYPNQMARLVKFGIIGNPVAKSQIILPDNTANCFTCHKIFNTNIMIPFTDDDERKYMCPYCLDKWRQ